MKIAAEFPAQDCA